MGELARRRAAAIGLPEDVADSLEFAGLLHDLGKLDPRFQAWLHGGDELGAVGHAEPLAEPKAPPRDRAAIDRARRRAGYPDGARHEALSVALTSRNPGLWARSKGARRDLVQFLIGTHHGRGRPFWPVARAKGPLVGYALRPPALWPEAAAPEDAGTASGTGAVVLSAPANTGLERLDSGWTDAFWQMVRDYGPWGLALLEAILASADHRRSRTHQEDRS